MLFLDYARSEEYFGFLIYFVITSFGTIDSLRYFNMIPSKTDNWTEMALYSDHI